MRLLFVLLLSTLVSCAAPDRQLEAHRAKLSCAFACGTFATMRQRGVFRDCDADKCIAMCDGKEPPKCKADEE